MELFGIDAVFAIEAMQIQTVRNPKNRCFLVTVTMFVMSSITDRNQICSKSRVLTNTDVQGGHRQTPFSGRGKD